MTQPTHTHKTHGGRFSEINRAVGSERLQEVGPIVVYLYIDKQVLSATTEEDWLEHWRPIAADDCIVCLGTGHDQIKGNKANPCGGCYGLGKVRQDGETPEDRWQLAEVAACIIEHLLAEVKRLREITRLPEVIDLLQRRAERQRGADWVQREQEWRAGPGHGHGGRRLTGD